MQITNNSDIRAAVKASGLRLWQIGEAAFSLSDHAFSRKMRHEFSPEEKARVFAAIAKLKSAEAKKATDFAIYAADKAQEVGE